MCSSDLQEVAAFGEALRHPEFRAMLVDYVKEVSDPANRAQYIQEMTQWEAEQHRQVTFLQPQPGYVIKTRVTAAEDDSEHDWVGKVFINICADANVEEAQLAVDKKDAQGRIPWAVPYSTSKPRRDVDKAGLQCIVFDVIFHPNVIKRTQEDFQFRAMVITN